MKTSYPKLKINLEAIKNNAHIIRNKCRANNIKITGVVKGCNCLYPVVETLIEAGLDSLGSSRINQLKKIKALSTSTKTMLLRIPMLSEIEDMLLCTDISMVSELATLEKIESVSKLSKTKHQVILMVDIGDLREGYWCKEQLLDTVRHIKENFKYTELIGIGTNLGCYGAIKPTRKKMIELLTIKSEIESCLGYELDYVSGGATSNLPLIFDKEMPQGINHLRIGEGILLCQDLPRLYNYPIEGMRADTFTLEAEIVELKNKPSYPLGEIAFDAFGNRPNYKDKGMMRRALLAIGKQDIGDHNKLIPLNSSIKVIGSSSDHLIVDLTQCRDQYQIGDTIDFEMYYQSLLYASSSSDVYKEIM